MLQLCGSPTNILNHPLHSHLTVKRAGRLPIPNSLALLWHAGLHSSDPTRVKRTLEQISIKISIIANGHATSTFRTHNSAFTKWVTYARSVGIPVAPPIPRTPAFDAHFECFVLEVYDSCEKKEYGNGRKLACTPKTFNGVFHGVNFFFEHIFGCERMETIGLTQAKKAYAQSNSRQKRRAAPLLWSELERIIALEQRSNEPWITLVTCVLCIMLQCAARWSCIFELHVQKTFRCAQSAQYPQNPSTEFSLVYWRKRKNTRALSATTVPYSKNKSFDCRTSFLKILRLFRRTDARHLIPRCNKVPKQDRWEVHTEADQHCSYSIFLNMYRAVMRLANNRVRTPGMDGQSDILPTLHEPRHGFVHEARSATLHKPLKFEVVGKHGGWHPKSVPIMMGYNRIDPVTHAAIIQDIFSKVDSPTTNAQQPPVKRAESSLRRCQVRLGTSTLYARVAARQSSDPTTLTVVFGSTTREVSKTCVSLLPRASQSAIPLA